MYCKDLKVVNLNIAEDNYEYKALFRLCTDEACMDMDLAQLTDKELREIKDSFNIAEPIEEIKEIIMEKVMEASKLESHITEGEGCCKDVDDEKTQRAIDSLSIT